SAGRRTVAAVGLARRLLRHAPRRSPGAAGRTSPAVVTPLPERREPPQFGPARADGTPSGDAAERGRLIRPVPPRTASPWGKRAEAERQPRLDLVPDEAPRLPSLDLLAKPPDARTETVNEEAIEKNARLLETVLEDYGVRGKIVQVRPGPV